MYQHLITMSLSSLIDIIMFIQYGWLAILLTGYYLSQFRWGPGSSNLLEFYNGHTTEMIHIRLRYSGVPDETIKEGRFLLFLCLLLNQIMVVLELVFYVIMFQCLKEKNKSLINIVQDDVLKVSFRKILDNFFITYSLQYRTRKNTITLVRQVITFFIEVAYISMVIFSNKFGTMAGFFEPGAVGCAAIVVIAIITVTQILTSPEIRRDYLKIKI